MPESKAKKMRIECTEDCLSDTDADTGQHYLLYKGDQVTVPVPYGTKLCQNGWARDLDGNVESAPREPGVRQLEVQKATVGSRGRVRG